MAGLRLPSFLVPLPLVSLGWAFTIGLSLAGGSLLHAAPSQAPLRGGFLQYNDSLATWPRENWIRVLQSMRAIGMDTVIIQMTAHELPNGTTHSFLPPPGQPDPTETILGFADTNGFKVYLGLYSSRWFASMTDSNLLARLTRENQLAAERLCSSYLNRNRPSFAGWYLPYEPWTAEYQPAEVARLKKFFRDVQQHCLKLSGNGVLAISPFISAQRPTPCRVEQVYSNLLQDSGIGILMLQDSVGAQLWKSDIPARVQPYAAAFKAACDANSVRFWVNAESFEIAGSEFRPCLPDRFARQLTAALPLAEEIVTFDFVHYMNPAAFLPTWGEDRITRMKALYAGYEARFIHPNEGASTTIPLHAQLRTNVLVLQWSALPGDSFELQTASDPSALSWTPAPCDIQMAEASGTAHILLDTAPARFFRLSLTSRLKLPESMIRVSARECLLGVRPGDTNAMQSELPLFDARVSGFWISDHEVTQSEYQNLMCANASATRGDLELPIENVSWNEATLYCQRLTAFERAHGRLDNAYEYRLPTEAEWECAARAGGGGLFSFGSDASLLPNHAWHAANSGARPHPVGTLLPNSLGLHDVEGNVFEWCYDWLQKQESGSLVIDPRGAPDGPHRAVRGGAWSSPAAFCRLSARFAFVPTRRATDVGFRVVVAPVR